MDAETREVVFRAIAEKMAEFAVAACNNSPPFDLAIPFFPWMQSLSQLNPNDRHRFTEISAERAYKGFLYGHLRIGKSAEFHTLGQRLTDILVENSVWTDHSLAPGSTLLDSESLRSSEAPTRRISLRPILNDILERSPLQWQEAKGASDRYEPVLIHEIEGELKGDLFLFQKITFGLPHLECYYRIADNIGEAPRIIPLHGLFTVIYGQHPRVKAGNADEAKYWLELMIAFSDGVCPLIDEAVLAILHEHGVLGEPAETPSRHQGIGEGESGPSDSEGEDSDFWYRFTPYRENMEQSLRELHERVLREGTFKTLGTKEELIKELEESIRDMEKSKGGLPSGISRDLLDQCREDLEELRNLPEAVSIEEKIREITIINQPEGTVSPLDVSGISEAPELGMACPISVEELREIYGTSEPTREQIKENIVEIAASTTRGRAVYVIAYRKGEPSEICFAGWAFD